MSQSQSVVLNLKGDSKDTLSRFLKQDLLQSGETTRLHVSKKANVLSRSFIKTPIEEVIGAHSSEVDAKSDSSTSFMDDQAIGSPIRTNTEPHIKERIKATVGSRSATGVPYYIEGLITPNEVKWPGPNNGTTVVTYSFLTEKPDNAGVDSLSGFTEFSSNAQQTVADAFELYENIANIRFDFVEEGGDIQIGYIDLPDGVGGRSSGVGAPSYLWMNQEAGHSPPQLESGSAAFTTLLHEIGHAIGLKHPHEGAVGLPEYQDNDQFTLMSYNGHPAMEGLTPRTPQLFDIAAVQYLYGVNTSHNSGNTLYTWEPNENFLETIWDTGGTDTFNAALQTRDVFIDLNPGGFSSIGANGGDDAIDNLAIAFDTEIENAIGGSGHDTLHGNAQNNLLIGMAGDDNLRGMAGDDALYGREGDDTLVGGNDNDRLVGEEGDDSLSGGDGDDILEGEIGMDRLNGGRGHDSLNGGNGADILRGGTGEDFLEGRYGNDTLDGEEGDDTLEGGVGRDSLSGGSGDDQMRGQAGDDTLHGEEGDDAIYGGRGQDHVYGGDGRDTIRSGDGNDRVYGGQNHDLIFGDDGDDELWGDNGNDLLVGGSGSDLLRGNRNHDNLHGGNGDDNLFGGLGNDTLNGVSNNQVTYGSLPRQYDTLTGGSGADQFRLYVSSRTNPYYLGLGFATITDFDRSEGDRIIISDNSGYTLGTGNWSGTSQVDTGIYYNNDLIGVLQDTTQVHLFLDFERLPDAIV